LVLHPAGLVSFPIDEIVEQLHPLQKWLGKVCISGGEPTLDQELPALLRIVRWEGFRTKIDTNSSQPEILARLLDHDLLEVVAMDVKTTLAQDKYDRCDGTQSDLAKIKRSIELIKMSGVGHEFRMTILPRYH
jgi:pyruvate formate lyase activating enzyme